MMRSCQLPPGNVGIFLLVPLSERKKCTDKKKSLMSFVICLEYLLAAKVRKPVGI
jgi:hypothetical protein